MKKIVLTLAMFAAGIATFAQVKMPAPSPTQTIKQDFGLGSVELTYSRPSVKGRKIFGGHEPFGEIWRTGANAATKIKFTEPVEMGGKKLDSGTYVIYTIPNKTTWEVIINKGLENWGADGYKDSLDVVRFKVPAMKTAEKIETMTMQFANVKAESCDLHIMWEQTAIAIPIKTNITEKLKAYYEKELPDNKKLFWSAAQFYFEYDKNNVKALDCVNKGIEANKKAFWMFLYKAKIEKEMGDKASALASAKTAKELATEAKNDTYIRDSQALIDELGAKKVTTPSMPKEVMKMKN
jgi:Protein of unknown function (DUF2911)